jgi:PAS domain S-box-containing protein/putative nucleotidyltransferase with HDIG domain
LAVSRDNTGKIRDMSDRPATVLLIEDNPGDARLIRQMLAEGGDTRVQLECVDRLSTGLERLVEGGIDIVLLDLGLPDSQGFDTFTKTYAQASGLPIVVLSGLTDEQLAIKTVQEGAQDYLVKGHLDSHALVRTIRYAIERKRAEELLRESETQVRKLFEAIPDSILVHDDEGTILHINEIGAEQLEWSAKDLVGRNLCDIVTPESRASIADHIKETHEVGWCRFETTYVSRSGWQIMVEVNDRPIKFDKEKAILRVAHDITERKLAEEKLRLSEEKYRLVVENAKEAIIITQDVKLVFVNRAGEDMIGYSGEILTSKPFTDFIHPDDRNMVVDHHIRRIKGEEVAPVYSFRVISQDGTVKWVELNAAVIQWKERPATLNFLNDITERKQAEEALKKSVQLLRDTGEMAKVGGWELDLSTKEVSWTEEVGRIHGVEPGYKPMLEEALNFYAPESRPALEAVLKKAAETGEPYDLELLFIPSGSKDKIWVRSLGKAVYSGGKIVKLAGTFQNIDKYKKAEEELQRSYHKLRESLIATVNTLASTVEMKDPYTAGHQRRVTILACAIAEEMGLTEEQFDGLRMAGLIHDIGKINVPAEILNKSGRISDTEFNIIKIHPQTGYNLLREIEFPWPVAQIVLQHHERLDGSGYPQGLKKEEIMLEARILAVADVVEAMASHRPYRPAHSIAVALEKITKNRGIIYDPEVVDTCARIFTEKGFTFE